MEYFLVAMNHWGGDDSADWILNVIIEIKEIPPIRAVFDSFC